MDCLIEFFDHDQLNNLADVFSFHPQKVVFLYDNRNDPRSLRAVAGACRAKFPSMAVETVAMDCSSLEHVVRQCKKLIHRNPGCYVDVTGGGELSAIGAYVACVDTFTPIFRVDLNRGRLVAIYGCKSLESTFRLPKLNLDSLLFAHGAAPGGSGHPTPPGELYQPLLDYCRAVFRDLSAWRDLCFYLQTGGAKMQGSSLVFSAPLRFTAANGRRAEVQRPLLERAGALGLIKNLCWGRESVSFSYQSDTVKKYMTDYGTWLELFTFLSLKTCSQFYDVRLSVKVDWNGLRREALEVTNEIDVTLFCGIHPVFISCKLSEPNAEALQELSVYASYFGGRYSRCVLVTLGEVDRKKSYLYWRAREMGITVVDREPLLNGELPGIVQRVAEMLPGSQDQGADA